MTFCKILRSVPQIIGLSIWIDIKTCRPAQCAGVLPPYPACNAYGVAIAGRYGDLQISKLNLNVKPYIVRKYHCF